MPAGIEPFFYRTADGAECDLILVRGLTPLACVEIKLGNVASVSRGLRSVIDTLGVKSSFILTYASDTYRLPEDVTVMSAGTFIRDNVAASLPAV